MYILTMVLIFYGANTIQTTTIHAEHSSQATCEAALKSNAAAIAKNDEGKVVMATCNVK